MYYSEKRFNFFKIFLALIFIGVAIFLLYSLLHGREVTTGSGKKDIHMDYTVCDSSSMSYPFLSKRDEVETNLKINIAFSEEELENIGLVYEVTFQDGNGARNGYNVYPGELNLSFIDAGISDNDALNNKFSTNEEKLFLSLYAEEDEIDEKAAPYFFLKTNVGGQVIKEREKIISNYEKQGFTCKNKE